MVGEDDFSNSKEELNNLVVASTLDISVIEASEASHDLTIMDINDLPFGKRKAKEKVFGPLRGAWTAPRDAQTARPRQLWVIFCNDGIETEEEPGLHNNEL